MKVFDRIFDRDDVAAARAVDVVDHGGKRRRLSGSCGTGHEHEAARFIGDFPNDGEAASIIKGRNAVRNDAKREIDEISLSVNIHAKTTQPFDGKRHVAFEPFLKGAHLFFVQNAFYPTLDRIRRDAFRSPERQVAVHAKHRRLVRIADANPRRFSRP